MLMNYTKEDLIDLIDEYISIDKETPIEFTIEEGLYILEFDCDYSTNYGNDIEKFHIVAKIYEEFNEEEEEFETILQINASGLLFDEIPKCWEDKIII